MKKIIALFLIGIFLSSNFSFADCSSCRKEALIKNPTLTSQQVDNLCANDCGITPTTQQPTNNGNNTNQGQCPGSPGCPGYEETINSITPETPKSVMGITCDEDLLVNGQCKMNIYDTLGIRKSVRSTGQSTSVGLFVQDVVLSATFFIGTVVTIALVVSGIMYIFAASSGKSPDAAKKGIIGSLVGLLIVVSSYVIIRLVQYIAKGF